MPDCTIVDELARGDDQVVGLDAPEAREDVAGAGRGLLLDVDDDQALRAQLRRDGLLVAGLHLALGGAPERSSALNATRPWPGAPHRAHEAAQPPSAGSASASSRVILCSRTSWRARVHRLHAELAAGLERGVDLVGLALADQVADRRGRHEHLGGAAALAVGRRQQLLGDDALQRHRQLHAHLLLLGGNTSTMRSTVWAVSCVWSVANTRWPVSAAVSAVEIVSRSLISPTRITSGSWRSAALRPSRSSARRRPARAG